LGALLWTAGALYALAAVLVLLRPAAGRPALLAGVAAHLAATVGRGAAIGFFPLTSKMESFSAAALATALVAAATFRPVRAYLLPLLGVLGAAMGAALALSGDLRWPPPLMRTIWYPLHIPLSFLAYATWAAAAAAAVAWWVEGEAAWVARVDRLALWGFALWSLSMVTGGVWGVVAWGSWFMWDPKVIWSVILWFHYAAFVHLRLTPSLQGRPGVRPALAALGFGFVLVAYVGTSFLFGRSSHAFG
ncbi:MAG TPA: cytochrome c biogenesis protein CcsA, partial [Anaeromyxobacter sp.]|nr:cytochrome c biogenesis protein CcsA [Anaeromyxobacter sp.]